MALSNIQPYLIPLAVAGFFLWRFLKFRRVRSQIPFLLKQGAVIVDVRTRSEYSSGAQEGSINIPLDELQNGAKSLDRDKPVILCCASGTRSGLAAKSLKSQGFKTVINAGTWRNTIL
jgi:rhodanese-related sulfurtransferase